MMPHSYWAECALHSCIHTDSVLLLDYDEKFPTSLSKKKKKKKKKAVQNDVRVSTVFSTDVSFRREKEREK